MIGSTCAASDQAILHVNRFRSRGVPRMSDLGSFDPRRACRQAVAWLLLLLLTAAGPASALTSQGGTPGQGAGGSAATPQGGGASGQAGSGSSRDIPRDQAGAPVSPAPPPPPPPAPPGGPPATMAAPGTTAAPATATTAGTLAVPPATPTPPAAAGPPGAVGGLAPSDRISVDVMQM